MGRALVLIYGSVCYLLFLGTLVYSVGFVANLGVPKSVDSGSAGAIGQALLWDLGLLSLFALQHSGMPDPPSSAGGRAWCPRRSSAAPTCC